MFSLGSRSTFTRRSTTSGSTCQWRAKAPWRSSFVHLAVTASTNSKQYAICVLSEWRTAAFSGDPDDAQQAAERLQARNTQRTSRSWPMLQGAPTQATQTQTRSALHHSTALLHAFKPNITWSMTGSSVSPVAQPLASCMAPVCKRGYSQQSQPYAAQDHLAVLAGIPA
jgi:hypothetical protein